MLKNLKNDNELFFNEIIENKSEPEKITKSLPDPQVKPRKHYSPRRSFNTTYKLQILAAFDECETATERGALLRKEGLYHSRITAWKQQLKNSPSTGGKKKQKALRTDHLVRENEQLKKKLAQAEAIIEIQKKVSALLGMDIHSKEDGE